jgi:hypothetical protein
MPFKLGRLRPRVRPRLRLAAYLDRAVLPAPPATVDYTRGVPSLSDMLANDRLGDCTSAGAAHILDSWRVHAGAGLPPATEADAIGFYSRSCGYNPADPSTDQGGDEITVLNYWRDHGYFADGSGKISGYAGVDAASPQQVKQAIWLFGGLYLGLELPDGWLAPAPEASGFKWWECGRGNMANGHCIAALGYDSIGLIVATWGMTGHMSWHALAAYATQAAGGEAYAVFSPDMIDKASNKAPNGFAADQLSADLVSL